MIKTRILVLVLFIFILSLTNALNHPQQQRHNNQQHQHHNDIRYFKYYQNHRLGSPIHHLNVNLTSRDRVSSLYALDPPPPLQEKNKSNNKIILIMAYKRIDEFRQCLHSLMAANHSHGYHLVVTQSVNNADGNVNVSYYERMVQLLHQRDITSHFKSITHITTPSTCSAPYGNAYHAFRNLVHGFVYTIKSFPYLDSLIVFEEDTLVSKDIFEFFKICRKKINNDKGETIKFATSAYFLHTTHPQYDWRLDKPIKRKSIKNEMSLSLLKPKEIVKVKLQGQIEFKVLAWMIHKSAIKTIIHDFKSIEDWVFNNGEESIINNQDSIKPDILIDNCNCWNHDRYLEYRFRSSYFLGSQSPRCTHTTGNGLSNPGDDYGFPVNQIYTNNTEFYQSSNSVDGEKGWWTRAKEYLPQLECPNRLDCYLSKKGDPSDGMKCGSVTMSTCLNIWRLQCNPCSGRDPSFYSSQCNEKYQQCCLNGTSCTVSSPFMIDI
ncbi:hypothetical protein DFA_02514 [Cavenderia fasciculata]|uniref:alpha-1,3-mannosyl-glycoprotein 2-beta-N-acetylglucosaminyltransferase n=1 Tax=Cavenderia fasciculata TaxID=261658 RepID=F4PZL1_CACFS|nr:uncharacterized protein DFA_02514 [Cavenderia fasciculata]EGG18775.1 hypothetical protein DFA_02514 [Cavenderia fasciculata]|eukprot:XP_004357237.1 hypothetical protein DFA_02514 [Cavenderia fasciculata]